MGSLFRCLVPYRYVQVTPPGKEEEAKELREKIKQEEAEAKKRK